MKGTSLVIGQVTAVVAAAAGGVQEVGQAGPGGTTPTGE